MKRTPQQPERRATSGATSGGGFTLIELLVTISIIVLLVGISVPVALRMLGGADVTRARASLNALAAALDEYKLQTGSVPDHTDETIPNLVVSDEDAGSNADTTIGLFLMRVMQAGGTPEKMIRSGVGKGAMTFDGDKLIPDFANASRSAGGLQDFLDLRKWALVDPWDTPLRYAARVSHTDTFKDDDYLPAHPNPFFASAGPDGEWGDADALESKNEGDSLSASEIEDADFAEDNVYSFDIE